MNSRRHDTCGTTGALEAWARAADHSHSAYSLYRFYFHWMTNSTLRNTVLNTMHVTPCSAIGGRYTLAMTGEKEGSCVLSRRTNTCLIHITSTLALLHESLQLTPSTPKALQTEQHTCPYLSGTSLWTSVVNILTIRVDKLSLGKPETSSQQSQTFLIFTTDYNTPRALQTEHHTCLALSSGLRCLIS